jgi:radical SAM-linked protein
MDIWLLEQPPLQQLHNAILDASPPGLEILHITQISNDSPKLQKVIEAAEYLVSLKPHSSREVLQEKIDRLLDSKEIQRTRRGKNYDLRPLIGSLEMFHTNEDSKIQMHLLARESATGRPDEVLLALELDPLEASIHRSRLFLETP